MSLTRASCPDCGKSVGIPLEAVGKRIRCGGCGTIARVLRDHDDSISLRATRPTDTVARPAPGIPGDDATPPPLPGPAGSGSSKTTDPASWTCGGCGQRVATNYRFCQSCGAEAPPRTIDDSIDAMERRLTRHGARTEASKLASRVRAARVTLAVLAGLWLVIGTLGANVMQHDVNAETRRTSVATFFDDEGALSRQDIEDRQLLIDILRVLGIAFGLMFAASWFLSGRFPFTVLVGISALYGLFVAASVLNDPKSSNLVSLGIQGLVLFLLVRGALAARELDRLQPELRTLGRRTSTDRRARSPRGPSRRNRRRR